MLLRARTAALVAIYVLIGASLLGADKPITLGLIIDGSTPEDRAPLRAYLTKGMGRPVNLVVPALYSEAVAGLADGSYDFACLGGLMYIQSHAKYGVIPLVQSTSDVQFHSVFITGAGSSIHSLRDLKGKRFAFGDINSTSGYLIPYRELKQAGINPETDLKFRYSGSHPATAALVEIGVVDAGAIAETVFDFLISGGKLDRKKVRVFHTSKPFVDSVCVARKGVPEAEREKFVRVLLALKEGKDDPVLKILRAKKFVVANDQEYATIRQIAKELRMF
jgi:phosphonate transport system substrate-binding protein